MLVPGYGAFPRRRTLAVVLLVLGVVMPLVLGVVTVVSGRSWVALTVDGTFLLWSAIVLLAALLARLAALGEVWWHGRDASPRTPPRWALVVAVGVCLPLGLGAGQVLEARHDLRPVFTGSAAFLILEKSKIVIFSRWNLLTVMICPRF